MPLGFNNTLVISAADTDGIAALQQLAAAGDLTLAASPVTLPNTGQRVSLTSAANLAAINFTIYGTTNGGVAAEYTTPGPGATTLVVPFTFATVSRVAADDAVGSDVSVGWAAEADTTPYVVDLFSNPIVLPFAMIEKVNGMTFTAQHTYDDIMAVNNASKPVVALTAAAWLNHATAASKTDTFEATYNDLPVRAIRMYGSGAGSVQFIGWQATSR